MMTWGEGHIGKGEARMKRHGFAAPVAATALLMTCAGCFTMTNARSGKVVSPGASFSLGGTLIENDVAPIIEVRAGLLPRWDAGYKIEALCHVMDTRIQILDEASNSIDVAVEGGVGLALVVRSFGYAGVAVSKDLGTWNPYCLLRYVDMAGIEKDDMDDASGPAGVLEALLLYVPPEMDAFWEVFLGAEIELGDHVSLVPELLVAPELTKNDNWFTVFNLGLLFKLQ
jgi:hypothetical protein